MVTEVNRNKFLPLSFLVFNRDLGKEDSNVNEEVTPKHQ